jgi:hypothetical protein
VVVTERSVEQIQELADEMGELADDLKAAAAAALGEECLHLENVLRLELGHDISTDIGYRIGHSGLGSYYSRRRQKLDHALSMSQMARQRWFMHVGAVWLSVCKTVGSAYVGSNPTPATTSGNGPWPGVSPGSRAVGRRVILCHHRSADVAARQWLRTYSGRNRGRRSGSPNRLLLWQG